MSERTNERNLKIMQVLSLFIQPVIREKTRESHFLFGQYRDGTRDEENTSNSSVGG